MMIQTTPPQVQTLQRFLALVAGRALSVVRDEVWFECVMADRFRRDDSYDARIADGSSSTIGTAQEAFSELRTIVPGSNVTAAGKSLSPRPEAALGPKDRLVESEEHDGTA